MSESELKTLRQVLREAVTASRQPVRVLERKIGLGSGNLARLLDGRMEIKVRHLLALAQVLGVPPGDFLEAGCPESTQSARHRLMDWIAPPQPKRRASAAAEPAADLMQQIRAVIRQELDQRAGSGGVQAKDGVPK